MLLALGLATSVVHPVPNQVYMKTTLFGLFGKVEIAEEKITKLPSILQIEKFLVAILFLDLTHGDLSF